MIARLVGSSLLAFALASVPRDARADAPAHDAQTAEALFQSGKEAMTRGDLTTACARFGESVALEPAAGSFLNLADCEEHAGRLASALAHFQAARDRLRPDDYRMAYASERITQLTPRVPRLTVVMNAPAASGATVMRDDTPLGGGSLGVALPVEPGAHVLVVRAPGREDSRQEVTLREGESKTIDVVPGPPAPEASTVVQAPNPSDGGASARGGTQRTLAIALGGVGLAAIAGGTVVGLMAKSTYDDARKHCPSGPSSCSADGVNGGNSAYGEATASTILFIAGGALAATGVTLYLTSPRTVALTPAVGARHAGLSMVGTW